MRTSLIRSAVAAGLLIPISTLALTYTNQASRYQDAPFTTRERAGISVLTEIGAIEGYPDGTFRPDRTVNRAEFLKIVFLSHPEVVATASDADNCFPDVRASDWFSRYVCLAQRRGIVSGYPDGRFRPANDVNYVEALKMLETLFGYDPYPVTGSPWYAQYVEEANQRGLLLSPSVAFDHKLTRGEMARLAAAFVAYSKDELDEYRAFERGEAVRSSSSARSSSSSSAISSSSSSVSSASSVTSSSSSSTGLRADFPARSRFLILGERSGPIASAKFFSSLEPVLVRGAEVVLEQSVDGIDAMFLVDSSGTEIAQLSLDEVEDQTEKTWTASFSNSTYRIPKSEERTLGIEVRMKARDAGGSSDHPVQVDTFRIDVQGEWSSNTYNSAPPDFSFPLHQTAQGHITTVTNALSTDGALPLGTNQLVAAFTIGGTRVSGAKLLVNELTFDISKSSTVTTTNWKLGIPESSDRWSCTVNGSQVSCSGIPESFGTLTDGPRTFRLFADVSLDAGASDPFLQVSLNQPGNTGELGAIRWSDGSATFNWVELQSPMARSTRFD